MDPLTNLGLKLLEVTARNGAKKSKYRAFK